MTNPFPGMNPYLEQPEFWSDLHGEQEPLSHLGQPF
jgi:hypothetical protein